MASSQGICVAVNGQVFPAAEARVSALDRGLLFGDGVYEVFSARGGRPLFWAEHLARLAASAAASGFEPLAPDLGPRLLAEVSAVCAAVGAPETYLRLLLTRGEDGLNLDPSPGLAPTRLIYGRALAPLDGRLRAEGCRLHPVAVPRRDDGAVVAKRAARPDAVAERAACQAAGAYEALRIDALGRVLEGSTSSFFGVLDGVLRTAPLAVGILAGITRQRVLALAGRHGLPTAEVALQADDLPRLTEAFITSSTRGLVPVQAIGDRGYPAPGPVTAALTRHYDALVEAELG